MQTIDLWGYCSISIHSRDPSVSSVAISSVVVPKSGWFMGSSRALMTADSNAMGRRIR